MEEIILANKYIMPIKYILNYIKNNNNLSNPFKKIIHNFMYKPYHIIVPIKDIETCDENFVENILQAQKGEVTLPRIYNKQDDIRKVDVPKVNLYLFENANIHINSSSIYYKNKLVTFRTKDERYNEGFVLWHDENNAKLRIKQPKTIEEGFFLGGNGTWNWFHFTIEILPKLLFYDVNKYSKYILVSSIIKEYPTMEDLLCSVLPKECKLIYLDPDRNYVVNKLYYISEINHLQFNRFDTDILFNGTFFNNEIVKTFSDRVISHFNFHLEDIEHLPDKIFLYRKNNTHRIAKNQEEIKQLLINRGFTPICMEELSLKEQIAHYMKAKFIVGISGAAWTNIIYCRNNPKAICFLPDNATEASMFSGLATIFNVNLLHILYENDGKLHKNNDFEIDTNQLNNLLKLLDNE